GLWSRMRSFEPQDLYRGLERGELCWGIGIRGTLHLVSAREHPAYAAVASATGACNWNRTGERTTPGMDELRNALRASARARPLTNEDISELAENWVSEHPEAI